MATQKWYVGPWVWDTSGDIKHWRPPFGSIGALDLRSIPQQSVGAVQDGRGIFVTESQLGSDYDLLGTGDWRDIKTSQSLRSKIPRRDKKRTPQGNDLLSHILDAICHGADPTGDSLAKPLMPDASMRLCLAIGGNQHQWKTAVNCDHWSMIRDVERADLRRHFDNAKAGKMKDGEHHRRILDALCDKYRLQGADDWKEFVPESLRKEIPGRLKHETTLSDNFNRANSGTLGTASGGFSWTAVTGSQQIDTNSSRGTTSGTARAEADLSTSDMFCEGQLKTSWAAGKGAGPGCRFDPSATTTYLFLIQNQATDTYRLFKLVTGTFTSLSASNATVPTLPVTAKLTVSGSTLNGYEDGVLKRGPITDTSITGYVRSGMYLDNGVWLDDWTSEDLPSTGIVYTQLERSTRGVVRGMYARFE